MNPSQPSFFPRRRKTALRIGSSCQPLGSVRDIGALLCAVKQPVKSPLLANSTIGGHSGHDVPIASYERHGNVERLSPASVVPH